VSDQALLSNEFLGERDRVKRVEYADSRPEPDTHDQAHRPERPREHDRACEEWVWLGRCWRGLVVTALRMWLREGGDGGELKAIEGRLA
jgi:hypothetical protein